MPYIPVPERRFLDVGNAGSNVGELTYSLQQELMHFLEDKMLDGRVRYDDLVTCVKALEGAKADFIDRILLPYEHAKRVENGDVWHPTLLAHLGITEGEPHRLREQWQFP